MKNNFVHVCFILDESGSMSSSIDDVKGSIKSVIDEQKKEKDGTCSISLFRFGTNVTKDFVGKDINEIDEIKYEPRGVTSMNDGIGTAIDEIGKWLSDMKEEDRPSKNLIVIMTDGKENNSKEYSLSKVKEMIKHQEEKYNWSFIYMGADITSKKDSDDLGIRSSVYFSKKNMGNSYNVINSATKCLRKASNLNEATATMDWMNCEFEALNSSYEKEKNIKL